MHRLTPTASSHLHTAWSNQCQESKSHSATDRLSRANLLDVLATHIGRPGCPWRRFCRLCWRRFSLVFCVLCVGLFHQLHLFSRCLGLWYDAQQVSIQQMSGCSYRDQDTSTSKTKTSKTKQNKHSQAIQIPGISFSKQCMAFRTPSHGPRRKWC